MVCVVGCLLLFMLYLGVSVLSCFAGVWCLHGRFGFGWFAFCYLCLLVSVNSVARWLVTYCMYGFFGCEFFVLWFGY